MKFSLGVDVGHNKTTWPLEPHLVVGVAACTYESSF